MLNVKLDADQRTTSTQQNENRVSPGQSTILELQKDHSANEALLGMTSSNLTRGITDTDILKHPHPYLYYRSNKFLVPSYNEQKFNV
jgi:hypothetical protein